jgi:hypothetical protein
MFHTHIISVLSGCYIYFTHMLQVFYLNVAYVSHICCKCFYLDVAYVSHIYCNNMFQNVSCCKCFAEAR